jgi:hypothetical protein
MRAFRLFLAVLVALGSARALVAADPSQAEAKKLVGLKQVELLKEFDKLHVIQLDPGKLECYKDYNAAVTKAKNAFAACVNQPAANSPLGKFNALTNAQLASFCGNKTLQDCVNGVISDQRSFCNDQTDFVDHLKAAKKAETHCLECDTLRDELAALQKKINDKGCGHILLPIRR